MSLTHNSKIARNEPVWSEWLSKNRSKLPDSAFSNSERRFPHHFVRNGSGENDAGRWTSGDLFLHRGGLAAAFAASRGARSGQPASNATIAHLQQHRRALGVKASYQDTKEELHLALSRYYFKRNLQKHILSQ